jgi:hypothetical protein
LIDFLLASALYYPWRTPARNAATSATSHNIELIRNRNRFIVGTHISPRAHDTMGWSPTKQTYEHM